jgi:hypothetical protein
VKRFPQTLDDLLQDKRHPMPQRHLRRIYADPITGKREWGLIGGPGGSIMGVYSLSDAAPIKSGGFAPAETVFAGAASYSAWQFIYHPR